MSDGVGGFRAANLGERGLARLTDRYCRLRVGEILTQTQQQQADLRFAQQAQHLQQLQANVQLVLAQAQAQATSASSAPAAPSGLVGQSSSVNAIALKEVVSPVLDTTCRKLTLDEIQACYEAYERQYGKGKRPLPAEEPTDSQLGAIKHLIEAGEVPYVDFNVFVPYGDRSVRKQKCMGQVFNQHGQLVTVELAGPATFELWQASYAILANALVMTNQVDLGNLDDYRKYFERFYKKHGESVYALMHQADVRSRSEHMSRVRRKGFASFQKALEAHNNCPLG